MCMQTHQLCHRFVRRGRTLLKIFCLRCLQVLAQPGTQGRKATVVHCSGVGRSLFFVGFLFLYRPRGVQSRTFFVCSCDDTPAPRLSALIKGKRQACFETRAARQAICRWSEAQLRPYGALQHIPCGTCFSKADDASTLCRCSRTCRRR